MAEVGTGEAQRVGDAYSAEPDATMTSYRIHEFGTAPREDRVPPPQVGPGDVLVRLAASVVSHHDLTVAGGQFPIRPPLPYVPGLEGAGYVMLVGSEVDPGRFPVGSAVRIYGGGLGATRSGTWAEFAAVPASAVTLVPTGLDLGLAAACGSAAGTAWAALVHRGDLQATERIGVTGASGAVGSLVLQLAVEQGARSRVGWVRSPARTAAVPEGVEVVVGDGPVEPVDLLVDTVGGPLLEKRLGSVRPGGRAVLVGYTAGEHACLSLPELLARDVSLLPLNMMRTRVPKDVASGLLARFGDASLHLAVEKVRRGHLAEAIDRLRGGSATGRVVFKW